MPQKMQLKVLLSDAEKVVTISDGGLFLDVSSIQMFDANEAPVVDYGAVVTVGVSADGLSYQSKVASSNASLGGFEFKHIKVSVSGRTTASTVVVDVKVCSISEAMTSDSYKSRLVGLFTSTPYTAETLPDPATLGPGAVITIDGIPAIGRGDGITGMQNRILAFPFNSDGIDAAVAAIVATGKPGVVEYAATDYQITRDFQLVDYVSHIGVEPQLQFIGDVPDADFTCVGGTRFILSPGVTAMKYNNVARASEEPDIALAALKCGKMYGITFIGGKRGVDIGAYLAMGPAWWEFDQLYFFDQTDDYAFNVVNFQHCQFGRIYASTQLTSGSGIRLGSALTATLLPGNSTVTGELYTYCKYRKNRSVVIESFGPSGVSGSLNELKVSGRLQGNRYGAATPDTISMVTTSGDANIVISDNTQFDLMQIGMPFTFSSAAPTGYLGSNAIVYFVISRNVATNTITVGEIHDATTPITPTSSGTYAAKCSGYPSIEIKGNKFNVISNSVLGHIDAEAFGNVCAVYLARLRGCTGHLAEVMGSATGSALAARDCDATFSMSPGKGLTQDSSGQMGHFGIGVGAQMLKDYSGGSFTLDSTWNGRSVRYTGTSDITITVPLNLPFGFQLDITPTAASGIVTFVAASGGSIYSKSGLRTNGQYATASLRMMSPKVFTLRGELQA